MATISKLFSTGVLQSSVELDEVTYGSIKVSPTGVYAAEFNEVDLAAGTAERRTNTGVYQVSGFFDEYTLSVSTSDIVTSNLVFNLSAAPSSGTTWNDTSGNGYNATLQGSTSYVSSNGGGIKLNNTNYLGTGYISVPYNISSNTVTVEVVASFNPTTNWATIWGNEIYNSGAGYYAYLGTSTAMTWGKPNAPVGSTITASNSIRQWIFVINGRSLSIYLNGTQLGTTSTATAQTTFTSNNLYFGSRHTNAGTGATDKMNNSNAALQPVFYQMRVYNKALNTTEITQNYNAIKSTYSI